MERIPPFHPGDRVVCIEPDKYFSADIIYTVQACWYCCEQWGWRVEICEVPFEQGYWLCLGCRRDQIAWLASCFRKIDEISDHTVESLLEELAPPCKEPILT